MSANNYVRIKKPLARKLYNAGYTVHLLPCKMRFDNMWMIPYAMNRIDLLQRENVVNPNEILFDRLVRNYEVYNCNAELGYYCAYYVTESEYNHFKKIK